MEKLTEKKIKRRGRLKRRIIRTSVVIISVFAIVIAFASPIARYLLEYYGKKTLGREVKTSWVYFNPFTGNISVSNFRVYEAKNKGIFFYAKTLSAHFSLRKALSKTYELNNFTIDEPFVIIVQNKQQFNFDDIVEQFKPDSTAPKKEPVHFNLLSTKIRKGRIYYFEKTTPIQYFVKALDFDSEGKKWNVDTIAGTFSFLSGPGKGKIKAAFNLDVNNLNYKLKGAVEKFDLQILEQYMRDLSNYGTFRASLDAKINANGNFKEKESINANGLCVVNDFHLGKTAKEDYLSFKKLQVDIVQLNPAGKKYSFDTVSLQSPYFKYERYDHLDNIQNMFGKKGARVKAVKADQEKFNLILEIADYMKVLVKNFFRGSYQINRLEVKGGNLKYNDFALREKFSIALNPFSISADSIDKNRTRVRATVESGIKPYGNAEIKMSVNPKDSSDFDLWYSLRKIPIAMFNPYLVTYSSFPLNRGTIEMRGKWTVRNGNIQSDNHLLVIDPRESKRVRKKDTKWIPVPLIFSFVRERGNVIDYEIPINGDLKNPKFRLRDVFIDLLTNIFVKPPTTPYRLQVSEIENEIEKFHVIAWPLHSTQLRKGEEKFVAKLVDFLRENPEAKITVTPTSYAEKEKEYILLYEAKKKYFLETKQKDKSTYTESDSIEVEKMSSKDSCFVAHLDKRLGKQGFYTIQQKCAAYTSPALIQKKYTELVKRREAVFKSYFTEPGTSSRVKLNKKINSIPYNGFSYFRVHYNGEIPTTLLKAYQELNELDEKEPRKKYKEKRKELK